MKSTQDILLLAGRVGICVPPLAEGIRQIEAWPGLAGAFHRAGSPFPAALALGTIAANLAAPVLIILGVRARQAALVLAAAMAAGLYLLHRIDPAAPGFQAAIGVLGGLLVLGAAGPGKYALEPGK